MSPKAAHSSATPHTASATAPVPATTPSPSPPQTTPASGVQSQRNRLRLDLLSTEDPGRQDKHHKREDQGRPDGIAR